MTAVIEVRNPRKEYGATIAVDDVSFAAPFRAGRDEVDAVLPRREYQVRRGEGLTSSEAMAATLAVDVMAR